MANKAGILFNEVFKYDSGKQYLYVPFVTQVFQYPVLQP